MNQENQQREQPEMSIAKSDREPALIMVKGERFKSEQLYKQPDISKVFTTQHC